ncbi:MAG: hypothetical protein K0M78_11570 [Brevundimonas sp.]|nr:hypothetical protein [Brevundimonas sp.]
MTPLADMIPAMSDPDLKALRANAARLSESGSAVQMNTAAEILPLIDAETARRAAAPASTVKKPRAPAKKKVVPASGHQTALPSKAALFRPRAPRKRGRAVPLFTPAPDPDPRSDPRHPRRPPTAGSGCL